MTEQLSQANEGGFLNMDKAFHIKMATHLMDNYESGKVPLPNVIRQIHYWVKSCCEAYAVIPPNSAVVSELLRFDGYRRQLGVDLLAIDCIFIRKVESVDDRPVSKTVLLTCVGNATVVIEHLADRVERTFSVGLSTYGRMEKTLVKLCETLAEGELRLPTFEIHNYTEVTVSADSGEGLREVALWRYGRDTAQLSTVLQELIQVFDEIISVCLKRPSCQS